MSGPVTPPIGYTPEPIHNIQRTVLVVIEELQEYGITTAKYRRLELMATDFYRNQLSGFNMPSLVSAKVNIDHATRTWAFPGDYIQYTKVAYIFNGVLRTLGYLEDLDISNAPQTCTTGIETGEVGDGGFWLAPYWGSNLNLYSSGGGFAANYYRVVNNQYLQFAETLPVGYAVVEYLSTGRAVNGLTLIPVAYEYAVKQYIKWQYCLHSPKFLKLAPVFRQLYEGAVWDSKGLMGKSPEDFLLAMYSVSGFKIR